MSVTFVTCEMKITVTVSTIPS